MESVRSTGILQAKAPGSMMLARSDRRKGWDSAIVYNNPQSGANVDPVDNSYRTKRRHRGCTKTYSKIQRTKDDGPLFAQQFGPSIFSYSSSGVRAMFSSTVSIEGVIPLLAFVGLAAGAVPARAAFVEVPLPADNFQLQDITNGFFYPTSGALAVGGVPFTIAQDASNNNAWIQWTGGPFTVTTAFDIPVGVFGVTTAYTLMNSFFGSCGVTIGSVEFQGSGGANAVFDLVEGDNIRDHFVGSFCNTVAPGTPSIAFSSGAFNEVHLDLQTFNLPAAFASETLTHIILTDLGLVGAGEPFIASVTVAVVPEPASLLLLGAGFAAMGGIALRRRRLATSS